jgi:hypothetical protein
LVAALDAAPQSKAATNAALQRSSRLNEGIGPGFEADS